MSFWTWITSDAPADEIVDEKWDARAEKVGEALGKTLAHIHNVGVDVQDGIDATVDYVADGLQSYSETEDRPWWKIW